MVVYYLVVYPQLTAAAVVTKTDCSGSPDAVITTTITGGRALSHIHQSAKHTSRRDNMAQATFKQCQCRYVARLFYRCQTVVQLPATTVSPITDQKLHNTGQCGCNAGSDGSV
jgi:hypothetical protein